MALAEDIALKRAQLASPTDNWAVKGPAGTDLMKARAQLGGHIKLGDVQHADDVDRAGENDDSHSAELSQSHSPAAAVSPATDPESAEPAKGAAKPAAKAPVSTKDARAKLK